MNCDSKRTEVTFTSRGPFAWAWRASMDSLGFFRSVKHRVDRLVDPPTHDYFWHWPVCCASSVALLSLRVYWDADFEASKRTTHATSITALCLMFTGLLAVFVARCYKRGLCRRAVSVWLVSVSYVEHCIQTRKHILKLFYHLLDHHSSFSVPNVKVIFWRGPLTGASNADGVWKNRDFRPILGFISEMIQDIDIVTMEY